jgi:hypothetical protein
MGDSRRMRHPCDFDMRIRRPYLRVCRILVKMADAFFSFSWRNGILDA